MNQSQLCKMLGIPTNSDDALLTARIRKLSNAEVRTSVALQALHRMRAIAPAEGERGKAEVGAKIKMSTGPLAGMVGIVSVVFGKINCYDASIDSGMDNLNPAGVYRVCADQIEIEGKVSDNGASGDVFMVISGGFQGCKGALKSEPSQMLCYDANMEPMDGMPAFGSAVRVCDDQIEVMAGESAPPVVEVEVDAQASAAMTDMPTADESVEVAKYAVGDSVKFSLSDSVVKSGVIEAVKPKCFAYSINVEGEGIYQWAEDSLTPVEMEDEEDPMALAELQAANAALQAKLDAIEASLSTETAAKVEAQNGEIAALLRLENADNTEASMGVLVSGVRAAMAGTETPVSIKDAVSSVKASLPRLFNAVASTATETAPEAKTEPKTPAAAAPGSLRARAVGALAAPPSGAFGKPVSKTQEFATPKEREAAEEARRLEARRMS